MRRRGARLSAPARIVSGAGARRARRRRPAPPGDAPGPGAGLLGARAPLGARAGQPGPVERPATVVARRRDDGPGAAITRSMSVRKGVHLRVDAVAASRPSSATSRAPIERPGTMTGRRPSGADGSRGRTRRGARSRALPPPAVAEHVAAGEVVGTSARRIRGRDSRRDDRQLGSSQPRHVERVGHRARGSRRWPRRGGRGRLAQGQAGLAPHRLGAVLDVAEAERQAAAEVGCERGSGGGELPLEAERAPCRPRPRRGRTSSMVAPTMRERRRPRSSAPTESGDLTGPARAARELDRVDALRELEEGSEIGEPLRSRSSPRASLPAGRRSPSVSRRCEADDLVRVKRKRARPVSRARPASPRRGSARAAGRTARGGTDALHPLELGLQPALEPRAGAEAELLAGAVGRGGGVPDVAVLALGVLDLERALGELAESLQDPTQADPRAAADVVGAAGGGIGAAAAARVPAPRRRRR